MEKLIAATINRLDLIAVRGADVEHMYAARNALVQLHELVVKAKAEAAAEQKKAE